LQVLGFKVVVEVFVVVLVDVVAKLPVAETVE
jgi:hypothetical protein